MDRKFITRLSKYSSFVFISPHLDDAVFSAGRLMDYLVSHGKKVSVVNAFTDCGTNLTLSARRYLAICGYSNAVELYRVREKEDRIALSVLGLKPTNLKFSDSLWRTKSGSDSWLPELNAIYPVFRFAKRISPHDLLTIKKLSRSLSRLKISKNTLVIVPSGWGGNIDHQIVRDVSTRIFRKICYWTDSPYFKRTDQIPEFLNFPMEKYTFTGPVVRKCRMAKMYESQYRHVVSDNNWLMEPENYYFPLYQK